MANQRSKDRQSACFHITKEVAEQLAALSAASRLSKTKVVEFLVAQEHQKRSAQGQLEVSEGLFPDPLPSGKAKKKRTQK
jgi:hypothetical protein